MLGSKTRPKPAGGEDDGLGADGVNLPRPYFQGHDAAYLAVLDDEGGNEPLFVAADAGLDELLEHHVEQGLPGEVANEEGARAALAAEGPGAQVALVVAVEGDAEVLHVNQGPARRPAHDLDGILITEEVAALDRVVGVVFPIVATVGQGCVDAALGCV